MIDINAWSIDKRLLWFKWRRNWVVVNPANIKMTSEQLLEEFERWVAVRRLRSCGFYTAPYLINHLVPLKEHSS